VIRLPSNNGKGAAIRVGMLEARGEHRAFSDADLSTPIEELDRLRSFLVGRCHVAIASRAAVGARIEVHQQWRREMSLRLTRERRPDLLAKASLSREEGNRLLTVESRVYVALLHYPVYDKNGQVVTSAVTNMDIHDIARSGKTYGIRGFYVVTPVKALQKLALKIIEHWEEGYGSQYNITRKEALALARIRDALDDVLIDIERECGEKPRIVATTARPGGNRTSFPELRDMLLKRTQPCLILFGTGWGLTETIISQSDYVLQAIQGPTDYNHLSVRSAAAIVLDRLLGRP